jgi:ATP-dependent DNA helicase RecG
VEESELLDLAAASERFDILQQHFGDKVGLIHGRMKPQDKDDVMQKFINGNTRLLVATTVIEVGVDVPDATIMVIEHAERFWPCSAASIARTRGTRRKTFVLFFNVCPPAWKNSTRASRNSAKTEDGFLIAEKDLTLRGSGEILGTRQSGLASNSVWLTCRLTAICCSPPAMIPN